MGAYYASVESRKSISLNQIKYSAADWNKHLNKDLISHNTPY